MPHSSQSAPQPKQNPAPVAPTVPPGAPTAPAPQQQQQSPVPKTRIEQPRNVVVQAGQRPVRHAGGIIRPGKTGHVTEDEAKAFGKHVTRR